MRRIGHAGDRVVFKGPILPGIGEHDYACAACAKPLLECVELRYPSAAVYECWECGALNVIPQVRNVPDEVAERLTRWYGEKMEALLPERRKAPR
jgi:hypothetical protein